MTLLQSRMYETISILMGIENGQRAGAIAQLKLPQWFDRIMHADGTATITVDFHKTAEDHGPVALTLSPDLQKLADRFITFVRPLLVKPGIRTEAFFISTKTGTTIIQLTTEQPGQIILG